MPDIGNLLAILIAFFIAAASPGPANIALATTAMSSGRRAGILFGLGLSVGLAFWGVLAATGLGAILQASGEALFILKILGGLYLVWLAYGSARSAARPANMMQVPGKQTRYVWRGLLLNLSNPKAVFAWMAVLAVGLGEESTTSTVMIATGLCMALGVFVYLFYAAAFSTSGAMSFYVRIRRWVDGIVAGLFAVAGLGLVRSAFSKG